MSVMRALFLFGIGESHSANVQHADSGTESHSPVFRRIPDSDASLSNCDEKCHWRSIDLPYAAGQLALPVIALRRRSLLGSTDRAFLPGKEESLVAHIWHLGVSDLLAAKWLHKALTR